MKGKGGKYTGTTSVSEKMQLLHGFALVQDNRAINACPSVVQRCIGISRKRKKATPSYPHLSFSEHLHFFFGLFSFSPNIQNKFLYFNTFAQFDFFKMAIAIVFVLTLIKLAVNRFLSHQNQIKTKALIFLTRFFVFVKLAAL